MTRRIAPSAAPAPACAIDAEQLAALEHERNKLKKINQVLMDRVERSMNVQGNAFSLFQTSVVLGQVVRDRTAALTDLNTRLRQEIAERRSIENALRGAKSEAERANLSKTQFFTAVSHDLLQPLNAARLFSAALLQRRLAPANRALAEKLEGALEAVDDLLNSLLEISKLDAGAVTPECSVFAVEALLDEVAVESASVARAHGLDFRYVPCRLAVKSDRRLLGRIVRNFLSNAIRYTGHGRILLGCLRRGPMLRIGVWDTGPGIPEDSLQAIFTEFRQLDVAGRTRGKGLGLGLAIVDRVSRMLEHPLWVRSRLGHGSCFAVDVPLAPHPPMPPSVRTAVPVLPGTLPLGTGVLVIDDEPAICQGMETLLGGWSCRVVTAASAAEALARLQETRGPINLIIADYHLSDGPTGRAAIEAVQAVLSAPVPALIITADRAGAGQISSGPYPVLSKPVRPLQLRLLITQLLASASPNR